MGIGRTLEEKTGSKVVPILLETKELKFSPNYSYTTKKIASNLISFQGRKELKKKEKKLKNKLKKELEKVIKKNNIKDLFNL